MFFTIFRFELQTGLRRPAAYLYFAGLFAIAFICFANGAVPAGGRQHYNSPYMIALWSAVMSMMMMPITSPVMGTPLYRDIACQTHQYYLTYPITRAGYFWGRFAGSFVLLLFISLAIPAGIWAGTLAGPALGWEKAGFYGPNRISYYVQPYLTIALPNLAFTSCFFFGLVSLSRNVKVIYTGGLILFLGYFLSLFFLKQTQNEVLINLADPFGLTHIRNQTGRVDAALQNGFLFPIEGPYLVNRIGWVVAGLALLLFTYHRFNFATFFSGRQFKSAAETDISGRQPVKRIWAHIRFDGHYNRRVFFTLFKTGLQSIIRDNYFWIVVSCGLGFLYFVFLTGLNTNGIPDLPRTVAFLQIDPFYTYLLILITVYTGEILHHDRATGYALIGDALPPPDWILGGSKLLVLLVLACCFSLLPLLIGLPIQLLKGFHQFNFPLYVMDIFTITLPKLLDIAVFAYTVHVLVNQKFVAHAIVIFSWVAIFLLRDSGAFDYNLLLYSYTPDYVISDMEGLGHMAAPVYSFTVYWLLCAGLLTVLASLFYYRGVLSSFRERLRLAVRRFNCRAKILAGLLLTAFLAMGGYLYYNVSNLNAYLTQREADSRAALYEKTLKRYDGLPLPQISRIKMTADLYPDTQRASIHAWITVANRNSRPVSEFLVDRNELTEYTIWQDGRALTFSCPLTYPRGVFNCFRPQRDTADFRLYQLNSPLAPGDSAVLEFAGEITHHGFTNGSYATAQLFNGTYLTGFLPSFGYDEDDELREPRARQRNGLPPKPAVTAPDPAAAAKLADAPNWNMLDLDITLSTSGDQTALTTGTLAGRWQAGGRNYFHYLQHDLYGRFPILSARYAQLADSILLNNRQKVNIALYYHPQHRANLKRFLAAYRDGLRYFSAAYGDYPFPDIRLAETSVYTHPRGSMATLDTYNELFGWSAGFTYPGQEDYCYLETAKALAQQWWQFEVAPNSAAGSGVISEGLPRYCALKLADRKYGGNNLKYRLLGQLGAYLYQLPLRKFMSVKEKPVLLSDEAFVTEGKAAVVFYGLADLAGEDRLNAALRRFRQAYAFKSSPPFAGVNDLYRILRQEMPDSLQYYLSDSFEKITLYDNRVISAKAVPAGAGGQYQVTLKISAAKTWTDEQGHTSPAKAMNDYIDIAVFGTDGQTKAGSFQPALLYLKRYKLTAGMHTLSFPVAGKPQSAGIDPYYRLVDRSPDDNLKDF